MSIATLEKKLEKFTDKQIYALMNDERRKVGLIDLYYHDKYILGYKDMVERTHRPMCEFVSNWGENRKKLFIGPRDCFKSSLDAVGYVTQLIAQNPMIKILIISETEGNAKKYLSEIQFHLSSNQVYKEVYSYLYTDYIFSTWNTEAINIIPAKEVKDIVSRHENTVDVGGVGTSKVGMHYDYIFFIDPHSQNNVNTSEQIEKVIVFYRLLGPLLRSGTGRLIVEMTRWSYYDLANHILTKEEDQFDIFIKSAEDRNPDGTLFFPERLSEEELRKIRESLGSYLYSCLYLSKPQSDKDKIFKAEIAQFYSMLPPAIDKITLLDPAPPEEVLEDKQKDPDDFAMLMLGVDKKDNSQYVIGKQRITRKMPSHAIAELIAFQEINAPEEPIWRILIETVNFQRIYKFEIQRALSAHGHPFQVIELKPGRRAKKARIMGLQPFWENGKIRFRAGEDGAPSPDLDLLYQFEKFPFGEKDDFIDLFAYTLDYLQPKREEPPNARKEESLYRQRILQARMKNRQTSFKRSYS